MKADIRFERRKRRARFNVRRAAGGRARLSVFRSHQHIYVQLIDDTAGRTLAAASTLDKEAAKRVGLLIAERAKQAGVALVVFDRGPYKYHGRVKALADGAREGGLSF